MALILRKEMYIKKVRVKYMIGKKNLIYRICQERIIRTTKPIQKMEGNAKDEH